MKTIEPEELDEEFDLLLSTQWVKIMYARMMVELKWYKDEEEKEDSHNEMEATRVIIKITRWK